MNHCLIVPNLFRVMIDKRRAHVDEFLSEKEEQQVGDDEKFLSPLSYPIRFNDDVLVDSQYIFAFLSSSQSRAERRRWQQENLKRKSASR